MANEERLIGANALRKKIDLCDIDTFSDKLTICEQIADAPTVEAVPVVHGRWVMTLYTTTSKSGRVIANKKFACSVCGYGNGRKQSNYCPNCGAKMDGDGNAIDNG